MFIVLFFGLIKRWFSIGDKGSSGGPRDRIGGVSALPLQGPPYVSDLLAQGLCK